MTVGQKIKTLRERLGMTQTELAHKAKCTIAAVSQWESGKRKPAFDSLIKIAKPLHTTSDFLLGREVIGDLSHMLKDPVAGKILKGFDDLSEIDKQMLMTMYDFIVTKQQGDTNGMAV